MTKPIVFVGSNHNITQMVDICCANNLKIAGIVDQDYWNNTSDIHGVPVIGSEYSFDWNSKYHYFIATNWTPVRFDFSVRDRAKRARLIELLKQQDIQCINLIHPTAIVPNTCQLGTGMMIGAGVIIGNYSVLGDYCQVREQSYLAHHCRVDFNSVLQVQSYTGHNVLISNNCYIGIKASIINNDVDPIIIPPNSFVKSHSLITNKTKNSIKSIT